MGKKYTQFTEDLAPTDDDILLGVDSTTGLTKRHTRNNLLTGNPIVDPSFRGSTDGDFFKGKHSGWIDAEQTVTVQTNDGQRQHVLKIAAHDARSYLHAGFKGYIDRATSAPTQCTDLEKTTLAQFWRDTTVSGVSFTDDFCGEIWAKPESVGSGALISRYNGTSGFEIYLNYYNQVVIAGHNAGSGNFRAMTSYQSVPAGRWTHIAANLDMSSYSEASNPMYFDGESTPIYKSQGGTNPTAIVQAGNLEVGATNGTLTFDGKLSEARLWSVIRTASQVKDNQNQPLTGAETNLVGYWPFDGNGNDLTSNANNLTANGTGTTPTATSVDNIMHDREFFIITKVELSGSDTLLTIFTGSDHVIPNATLNSFHYSNDRAPYGFPAAREKWRVSALKLAGETVAFSGTGTWTPSNFTLAIPVGDWMRGYQASVDQSSTVSGVRRFNLTLDDAAPTNGVYTQDLCFYAEDSGSTDLYSQPKLEKEYSVSSKTTSTLYGSIITSTGSETYLISNRVPSLLYAQCSYV